MGKSFMLIVLFASICLIHGRKMSYSNDKVNVHIIPHTHDDPGWLKTYEQYYYGSNSSIYKAGVQFILDTVTSELQNSPERKFVYVEMSFFSKWYTSQSAEIKSVVRKLVADGQLSFANGGWCMHDEASTHYISMIDQTTHGHRFLLGEFNYTPRVGWQIDPFGHSATQASLLSSEMGFDALYFGRIDYQDHALRRAKRELEFVWRSSSSLPSSQILTGVFSDGNYGPPKTFCFDVACTDEPLVEDSCAADYNEDGVLQRFIEAVEHEQSYAHSQGNHIALRMGGDFCYTNAHMWYKNLDRLIALANNHKGEKQMNVFYSSPTQYTDARAEEKLTWTVKTDDFFPYADCAHCYWSGYFTSRPSLKYLERVSSSFLQILKQVTVATGYHDKSSATTTVKPILPFANPTISLLTEAVGLANHHDAVTGTSKQHVADDYTRILDRALTVAEEAVAAAISGYGPWRISPPSQTQDDVKSAINNDEGSAMPSKSKRKGRPKPLPLLKICRLALNESYCPFSEDLSIGEDLLIVAYNPLPRRVSQQLSVYLGAAALQSDTQIVVLAEGTTAIASELVPFSEATITQRGRTIKRRAEITGGQKQQGGGGGKGATTATTAGDNDRTHSHQRAYHNTGSTGAAAAGTAAAGGGAMLVFQADDVPALFTARFVVRLSLPGQHDHHPSTTAEGGGSGNNADVANAAAATILKEHSSTTSSPSSSSSSIGLLEISNGIVTVSFDQDTGLMKSITRKIIAANKDQEKQQQQGRYDHQTNNGEKQGNQEEKNTEKQEKKQGDQEEKNTEKGEGIQDSSTIITAAVTNSFAYYKSYGSPGLKGQTRAKTDHRDPHARNLYPADDLRDDDPGRSAQASGAYIFRPSVPDEIPTFISDAGSGGVKSAARARLSVVRGELISEVRQVFDSWVMQTVRIRSGSPAVELEWTVGPIPIDDQIGKEVVSHFESDLASNGSLYTDSNGREFLERKRNARPSWPLEVQEEVAGNFYPISIATYIRDEGEDYKDRVKEKDEKNGNSLQQRQLSIISDRGQAVASIHDGAVELMVHRRLVADDGRGVDEPLNETTEGMSHWPDWRRRGEGVTVSGRHWLLLSSRESGVRDLRTHMDRTYAPMQLLYGGSDAAAAVLPQKKNSNNNNNNNKRSASGNSVLESHEDTKSDSNDIPGTKNDIPVAGGAARTNDIHGAGGVHVGPVPVPTGNGNSSDKLAPYQIRSPLRVDLPANIHLVTLDQWSATTVLVRLAHQFAVDEDRSQGRREGEVDVSQGRREGEVDVSQDMRGGRGGTKYSEEEEEDVPAVSFFQPVTIDLAQLLAPLKPVAVREMTLSANQLRSDMIARKIPWQTTTAAGTGSSTSATSDSYSSAASRSTAAAGKPISSAPQQSSSSGTMRGSRALAQHEDDSKITGSRTITVTISPMEVRTFLVDVQ